MHKQDSEHFKAAFLAALAQAKPIPLTEHQEFTPPAWPVLDEKALYGLAGDVVRVIGPHTEADPVALLIQTLLAFGNVIGRNPPTASLRPIITLSTNLRCWSV